MTSVRCFVCHMELPSRGLYLHLHEFHYATLTPTPHLERALAELQHLTLDVVKGSWACPVCAAVFDSECLWEQHLVNAQHGRWGPETIQSLREHYDDLGTSEEVKTGTLPSGPGEESDWDEEAGAVEGRAIKVNGEEDDEDWGDVYQCLYCPTEHEDLFGHMLDVHGFDFRAATRAHPDVVEDYDLIRLVNVVRRSVSSGTCPCALQAEGAAAAESPTPLCTYVAGPSGALGTAEALERHLVEHPTHRLPAAVPKGDDETLIPFLPGDAMLSLMVTEGEGFLRVEIADPAYPLVPTVGEWAARKREQLAAAASAVDDDSDLLNDAP